MQAPKAHSATQNTIMGKVSSSPYKKATVATSTTKAAPSNMPVYAALIMVGVAIVLFMRVGKAQTGPLVVLTQSAAPDQSTIDNLTESIKALSNNHPDTPSGGTSTPLTTSGA